MSSTIFACKTHLCKYPNYSNALMKQSNKIPTGDKKMLAFGEEIGFKIKVHHPKIISTSKNWFLHLDRFWKQNMLLKVPTLVSSFSGVECTLTEPFRTQLKGMKRSLREQQEDLSQKKTASHSIRTQLKGMKRSLREQQEDLSQKKTASHSIRRCITGGVTVVVFFLNIVPEASGNNLTSPPHASYDCEVVSHYYSPLEGLNGAQLVEKMHGIISPHHSIPYKQVWDALKELDAVDIEQRNDSPNVIEIYSQKAVPKALAGKLEGWNREHLWPRSYGLITGPELTDLHNLHPADVNVNSSRGNKYYGECVPSSSDCLSPANPEAAPDTATDKERWLPPAKVRGDIARSVMYMAICYGFNQPPGSHNLQLSDSPSMENARMGLLSVLLQWHQLDPPSRSEQLRNDSICKSYQYNRNPFVDHPEYVNLIWADSRLQVNAPNTPEINSNAFLHERNKNAWINELHYENKGKDKNEFIEVVVGSCVDPSKLKLLLYNGARGKVYSSLSLSNISTSSVADTNLGFSIYTIFLPTDSLQNGPADGIALVEEGNEGVHIIQFVSYEGVVEAVEGPLQGLKSEDIGVSESKASSSQDSLGLAGPSLENFHWTKFVNGASPGKLNKGQIILSQSHNRVLDHKD